MPWTYKRRRWNPSVVSPAARGTNIHVMHGDHVVERPDKSIDMARVCDVLHIAPASSPAQTILSSIHRVLKPQGILSVTCHHMTAAQVTGVVTNAGLFRSTGRTRRTLRFEKARTGKVETS